MFLLFGSIFDYFIVLLGYHLFHLDFFLYYYTFANLSFKILTLGPFSCLTLHIVSFFSLRKILTWFLILFFTAFF